MSLVCSFLQSQQKELLVFGYIRLNVSSHSAIPYDIIKMCDDYFKDSLIWNISNNQIKELENEVKKEIYGIIESPTFDLKGHEFQLQLSAYSGDTDEDIYVQFEIAMTKIWQKKNIKAFTLYYEVNYVQNKILKKGTHQLWAGNPNHLDLDVDELWNEWINCKSISFDVYLDVLSIKYKNKLISNDIYFKQIKMNTKIQYNWMIDKYLFNRFKQNGDDTAQWMFHSNNFGLNGTEVNGNNFAWTLFCIPQNEVEDRNKTDTLKTEMQYGLYLLNLPPKVGKLSIDLKIESECDTFIMKNTEIFFECPCWGRCPKWKEKQATIPEGKWKKLSSLNFNVQIVIIEVFDEYGMEIDKSIWNDFGICSV